MSDETILLPCPICGKKVHIGLYGGEPDYWWMVHGGMHYDECKCRLFMESCKFELEDEARVDYDERAMNIRGGLVGRWNTRAELGSGTCEFSPTSDNPPTCSNCGWQADAYDCEWLDGGAYEYDGKFCKQCGARIRKAVER